MLISLVNVMGTSCQYEALDFVSFALQVVGKSFKMVPVMVWGKALSGKSFPAASWIVAACITCGTALYAFGGGGSASTVSRSTVFHGVLLIACFLVFDGFQTTYQERVFKQYKPLASEQMLKVNLISSVVCLIALVYFGKLSSMCAMLVFNPTFALQLCALSISAAAAQWFIYSLINSDGALAVAVAINIRQALSIILSYVVYKHPITRLELLGVSVIVIALSSQCYRNLGKWSSPEQKPIANNDNKA